MGCRAAASAGVPCHASCKQSCEQALQLPKHRFSSNRNRLIGGLASPWAPPPLARWAGHGSRRSGATWVPDRRGGDQVTQHRPPPSLPAPHAAAAKRRAAATRPAAALCGRQLQYMHHRYGNRSVARCSEGGGAAMGAARCLCCHASRLTRRRRGVQQRRAGFLVVDGSEEAVAARCACLVPRHTDSWFAHHCFPPLSSSSSRAHYDMNLCSNPH